MIKIANNLQRLVKAANNPTPAEQEAAMRQIMGLRRINPQLSGNMIGATQQTQLQNQAMGMTPEQAQFASPEAIQGRMAQRNIVNKLPFTRAFDSPPETTSTTYSGVLPKPHIVSPVDVDIIGAWIRQALNGPQHLSSTMPQVRLPQPFSPSMISTTPPAQFTPSPAQQQFAQTAMGMTPEQAQFASPEAIQGRMNQRNTALGVPAAQPVQPNMASIDLAALGRAAFAGANTGVASTPRPSSLFQQALRSSDDMFSINPLFMRPQQPQFTPSPAQQQFAQTAMGMTPEQAQFASPEAVRARMSARNQRHTPAPHLMSPMPKPDYRKF